MDQQQQRRVLDEARETAERLAGLKPRPAPIEGARATGWRLPEPEPEPRGLDTDLGAMIHNKIAAAVAERERLHEMLVELTAVIQDEADDAIATLKEIGAAREVKLVGLIEQLHGLRIENAKRRADFADLRAALATRASGRRGACADQLKDWQFRPLWARNCFRQLARSNPALSAALEILWANCPEGFFLQQGNLPTALPPRRPPSRCRSFAALGWIGSRRWRQERAPPKRG
jgi:hypothetical protein